MLKSGKKSISLVMGLVFLCTALFSGCSITGEQEIKKLGDTMSEMDSKRQRHMNHDAPVQKHDRAYLGKHRIKIAKERNLPGFFDERIVMVEKPMTLPQAVSRISQVSGIPIELSARLQTTAKQNKAQPGSMRPDKVKEPAKMPLQFDGKLKHLLDNLCSYHGTSWEWEDGKAYIYRLKSITYELVTSAGETLVSSQISNENKTGGGSSGKSAGDNAVSGFQTAKHEYEFNLWETITENIESMLSENGKVVVTQTAGTVSVTDTPSIHKDVRSYLDQVNNRLARQVAISVKIYSFTTNDSDSFGYSLKAAFEDAKNEFSVGLESLTSNVTDPSGLFNAAILEKSPDAEDYDRTVQQWEGSEAIVQALDKRGDVKLITSGSGIVMNNQPLPIQNTNRVGYLKSSEISQGETSTTAALESGTITTGFALSATPHILKNNEVVLRYNLTLSELDRLDVIEAAGTKIQTPEVSARNFMQQARMKMGETLFLAGFQRQSNEFSSNKTAKGVLGWQKDGSTEQEMILIAITVNEVDA